MNAALIVLAFMLGAWISIYQPMNSMVSRIADSPLAANVAFYLAGFLVSLFLFLASGGGRLLGRFRLVPPLLLTAGIMSALMVLGTIALLPRLGARRLFLLQVAGQVLMAMIVGHHGLFELPRDPLTLRKAAGAVLILAGVAISLG